MCVLAPRSSAFARAGGRNDWQTLRMLLPYLWAYRGRVMTALGLHDRGQGRQRRRADPAEEPGRRDVARAAVAACWWSRSAAGRGYGLLRLSTSLFNELRELVFAKATEGAARSTR